MISYENFVEEHSLCEFDDYLNKKLVEDYYYHLFEAQPEGENHSLILK